MAITENLFPTDFDLETDEELYAESEEIIGYKPAPLFDYETGDFVIDGSGQIITGVKMSLLHAAITMMHTITLLELIGTQFFPLLQGMKQKALSRVRFQKHLHVIHTEEQSMCRALIVSGTIPMKSL